MAKRKLQEINAGSMADIAFLLLIFFLVTTTMEVDTGITRMLPPPNQEENTDNRIMHERNVFVVLINKNNQLAIKGQPADISEIREKCINFFLNPTGDENLSELKNISIKLEEEYEEDEPSNDKIQKYKTIIKIFGDIKKSSGVVSLQNDRGTKYAKYIMVQNEIVGAINDLRNDLSNKTWGQDYDDLTEDKQDLVKEVYPFAISEATPRNLAD